MTSTIKVHLDEHVSTAIADGLRRRQIDVTTTPEAGLRGASDRQQLAYARSESRVIVTHDSDYLRLHAAGEPHAGIAFCRQGSRTIGEMLRTLTMIHETLKPSELKNRIVYL